MTLETIVPLSDDPNALASAEQPVFCKFSRGGLVRRLRHYPFKLRYTLPSIHSSSHSASRADTRRRQDAVFGKMEATRVRRLSSRFILSSPLVVLNRARYSWGRSKTEKPMGRFSSAHSASFGASLAQIWRDCLSNRSASALSGALKMARIR